MSLAQSNLFALIIRESPSWLFYAPETRNASGKNKICSSSKDEARDGLSMLTVPGADIGGAIR